MSNIEDNREGVRSELNGSTNHIGTVQIDNLLNFTKKSKLNLQQINNQPGDMTSSNQMVDPNTSTAFLSDFLSNNRPKSTVTAKRSYHFIRKNKNYSAIE